MTDKEVDEKCKLFRPIPLYLQQAVLAVPNGIRNNPYTDLPNVSKDNYVAPQSVNVMAQNAQTFFNVSPTSFVGAYNKLINKEMATNEIELDRSYGINDLFREKEGFYRTENAFAGVGGGGMFQTLVDVDMSASARAAEQNVARQAGTGLIPATATTQEMPRMPISKPIQSSMIPGLVTQTRTDEYNVVAAAAA